MKKGIGMLACPACGEPGKLSEREREFSPFCPNNECLLSGLDCWYENQDEAIKAWNSFVRDMNLKKEVDVRSDDHDMKTFLQEAMISLMPTIFAKQEFYPSMEAEINVMIDKLIHIYCMVERRGE